MSSEHFHVLDQFNNRDFDRGAPLWKEILWVLVSALWFETAFPLPSAWRVFWLRRFGARIGRGVVIRSKTHITMPWRLTVGDHVWIGEDVLILSLAPVEIGAHVCLSQRVFLCTGSHDFRARTFDLVTKPVHIGAQSWIAAQAFIAPGVEIGAGCVVSAGSVVFETVPPGSLVQGNPAQVRSTR